MARRKSRRTIRSRRRIGSRGRGRRTRSAIKMHTQRSKRTTITVETTRGWWDPKRTTVYEEFYEEEW